MVASWRQKQRRELGHPEIRIQDHHDGVQSAHVSTKWSGFLKIAFNVIAMFAKYRHLERHEVGHGRQLREGVDSAGCIRPRPCASSSWPCRSRNLEGRQTDEADGVDNFST